TLVSTTTAPPAPAPLVEKSPKVAESQRTPSPPVHISEPKPAAPATPLKGAEALVALSSPTQPRASEPPPASSKPPAIPAPKRDDYGAIAGSGGAPQALFFKGPERPPATASHKIFWLGLGLALCAAAGGAITWMHVNRRRK